MASSLEEYNYVTEPSDSLKCSVCLDVAKDPKQHEDCGKLFCTDCIQKNGDGPCPTCRAENPQYFKDMKSLREIKELQVLCGYNGCPWKGTVRDIEDHMTQCGYVIVSCPNGCNDEDDTDQLTKKDLENHLNHSCPNRKFECIHCGEMELHSNRTFHNRVCRKKLVSCPNYKCSMTMERENVPDHIENHCNYCEVACRYSSIGCQVRLRRKDLKNHEGDKKLHYPLALDKVTHLQDVVDTLTEEVTDMKVRVQSLVTTVESIILPPLILKNKQSLTFKMPGFTGKKDNKEEFYSDPFYTNSGQHKMCIKIYPNGCGFAEGTHLSMFVKLLEKSPEELVQQPFLGSFVLEILNQEADGGHKAEVIEFDHADYEYNRTRKGYGQFVSHSALITPSDDDPHYLMEDSLVFRITVLLKYHKPWLDCTVRNLYF